MRIAVNMVFRVSEYQEKTYRDFIFNAFKHLTDRLPEHQFLFVFDRPFDKRIIPSPNITSVILRPAAKNSLLWKFWLDVKLPGALTKYGVDVLISGGSCSSSTKVPQCLFINDPAPLHKQSYSAKCFKKAKVIVTTTEFSKQEIINRYQEKKERINVVYAAAREYFKPTSTEVADAVRNKLTNGKAYFLCCGFMHPELNPVTVLKGFSIFKKRQRSNMKLVFVGDLGIKHKSFTQSLKTYRYRDEVRIAEPLDEDELIKITGSAYAVFSLSLQRFDISVLEVMKCGVPLITSALPASEVVKDAALYVDTMSVEDIANKMMLIYKDENLRKELIEKGGKIVADYSWKGSAEMLWEAILKAVD